MQIIDVSEHQGQIDWDAAAQQVQGAIIRASGYGWDRADYQFYRNRDELRRIGCLRGFYYFAGLGDPVQQANRFADIVGPLEPSETVWLDWEDDVMQEGEAWALTFLRHATARFGVTCGIYMSASPARSGWATVIAEGYPLWVAAYNDSNPFWPGSDSAHWPWSIWQYSSTGSVPGIDGNVDMNTVANWPAPAVKPKIREVTEMAVARNDLTMVPIPGGVMARTYYDDSTPEIMREWVNILLGREALVVVTLDGVEVWNRRTKPGDPECNLIFGEGFIDRQGSMEIRVTDDDPMLPVVDVSIMQSILSQATVKVQG